jgi:hypothetical protein
LEDNIKTGLIAMEWEVVDWVNQTYERELWEDVVKTALELRVP